jgi:hypothetical protein
MPTYSSIAIMTSDALMTALGPGGMVARERAGRLMVPPDIDPRLSSFVQLVGTA